MGQAEASFWSIDRIVCSAWHEQNHTADIYISNYQGDSIDFQVVRTPDGDIVPFNVTSDFHSSDWYEHTSEQDGVDSVIIVDGVPVVTRKIVRCNLIIVTDDIGQRSSSYNTPVLG